MKQGWEIKKLGDIASIKSGKSIDANQISCNTSLYPCYGGNGIRGFVNSYSYDGCFPIIGRVGALCGNVHLAKGRFYATEHALVVKIKENNINPKWLKYNLISLNLKKIAKGVAQPVIAASEASKISIPVPPIAEQEKIVAELDCLSGIIEKKKQQLKEYDALAQSIFYEMFGDPLENDKGWENKKFKDCYKLTSGKSLTAKKIIEGNYPVYGGNGIVGYHYDYNLDGDNIIIGRVGALCGNVRNIIGKAFITDNAFILTKLEEGLNVFILYLLKVHNLRQYARDALQPVVSNTGFQNIDIIIPPLSLQQEFASKIEAIEKQKALIRKSIEEVETLFNSRMDLYFN